MSASVSTILVGFLVAATAACGSIVPRPARPTSAVLDTDGDGRVSHDEFLAWMTREGFAHVDVDRNGSISWDEWREFDTSFDARRNFEALDTDRDERISPAEWSCNLGTSGVALRIFASLDVDRDDLLSASELDRSPVAPIVSVGF